MIRKILKKVFYSMPSSKILMFHHVSDEPEIKCSGCLLKTEDFYSVILKQNKIVPIKELLDEYANNYTAITFDDGLLDVYTTAYPFLKKHNIPFTIFIVTDYIDQAGYLSKKQLRELCLDPLVTVGSHGVTHRNLGELLADDQAIELNKSKDLLSKMTGIDIDLFAYSHGSFNNTTLKLIKHYKWAFSVIERPVNFFTIRNKYTIPRYNVDSNTIEKYK